MPDITSINLGLQSLKTAMEIVKAVREADESLSKAETKLKLAELSEALADTKMRLVEAQEEILELRDQLKQQGHKIDLRSQIRIEEGKYVPVGDGIPGYGKGPWCSRCFDSEERLITLHRKAGAGIATSRRSWSSYVWECPECKSRIPAK